MSHIISVSTYMNMTSVIIHACTPQLHDTLLLVSTKCKRMCQAFYFFHRHVGIPHPYSPPNDSLMTTQHSIHQHNFQRLISRILISSPFNSIRLVHHFQRPQHFLQCQPTIIIATNYGARSEQTATTIPTITTITAITTITIPTAQ